MKALILASGIGKRLRPITNSLPKALIKIKNRPLLQLIMDSLIFNGIKDFVITTGYLGDEIIKFVTEKYPDLSVKFVYNPDFEKTNAIYSMWLAHEYLKDDDILYLHSDLLFDSNLITKLVNFKHSGCLVNKNETSKKDFNAKIIDGIVKEIGVNITGDLIRFCLPIYKFNREDFIFWMKSINGFVEKRKTNCYAEVALNDVLNKIKLFPIFFDKEIGMEIDDFDDLNLAEKLTNL